MKWILMVVLGCVLSLRGMSAEEGAGVGFSEADRAQLDRDKLLVSDEEVRQTFEPYIRNEIPVFITSDAVLNAFHVLFEESMVRTEAGNAPKLQELLEKLVESLPTALEEIREVPKLSEGAGRRAEIMLKTGLRLLGGRAEGSTAEFEEMIAAQVLAVEEAKGERKPKWLGPPDAGFLAIDFSRYRPRGFYADSPGLMRVIGYCRQWRCRMR